jgi:hypothetical protein
LRRQYCRWQFQRCTWTILLDLVDRVEKPQPNQNLDQAAPANATAIAQPHLIARPFSLRAGGFPRVYRDVLMGPRPRKNSIPPRQAADEDILLAAAAMTWCIKCLWMTRPKTDMEEAAAKNEVEEKVGRDFPVNDEMRNETLMKKCNDMK